MDYVIYLIHNTLNNKVYVGKTNDLARRWREHISHSINPNSIKFPINFSIAKYGKDVFEISVIQIFDNEKTCLEAEKYWISYFKSTDKNYGYNLTDGGDGVSGWHHTTESKNKMSISHKGMKLSERHKINIGLARLGFNHAKTTIEKLSGENSAHSKLTQVIVNEIRKLYLTGEFSHRKLAHMFNISKTQITNILNNKQWK